MNLRNKPELIIIAGPTATGKTEAAVRIAETVGGEVISADSIQVYRGMDIGSAKATAEEMRKIPHHLIDVIDIDSDYNVAVFKDMAKKAMDGIYKRGRIPVVCGGTGFYIQALIYDIDFEEETCDAEKTAYRNMLEELYKSNGIAAIRTLLSETDPAAYANIDLNNSKRVIRAIEYMHFHNESICEHNEREKKKHDDPPYDIKFFVLYGERSGMYRRIDRRVDQMMKNGLLEEVEALKKNGLKSDSTAGQGIGYKELLSFLDGKCTLDEAVENIKRNTRHFAKRQLTWFRREKNAVWIDIDKGDPSDEIRKYL